MSARWGRGVAPAGGRGSPPTPARRAPGRPRPRRSPSAPWSCARPTRPGRRRARSGRRRCSARGSARASAVCGSRARRRGRCRAAGTVPTRPRSRARTATARPSRSARSRGGPRAGLRSAGRTARRRERRRRPRCPGRSCAARRARGARLPQYVQDVVDLVEYANGAPDTRWGAVRTAAGHPEPFGLRMIGLGNEDVVDAPFVERFVQLTEALREAHPEIELIGSAGPWPFGRDFEAGWELCRRLGIDLVDEHGYRTPRWLWQNHERYNAYDRTGPAVYLGEWAARSSTVRSAIAEAGGDQVLDVQVSGATLGHQPEPRLGPTALTCPGARVSFTHIEADGVPLPDVMVDDEHPEAALGVHPRTRRLALTATRQDGTEGFQVRLGDPASGTTHEVIVGSWGNKSLIWSRSDDGLGDEVDGPYPFAGVQTGVPRRIEVERDGSRVVVRHDGAVVHNHTDGRRSWPEIVVGATSRTVEGDVERVVTIVNGSDRDRTARVSVAGMTGPATATSTVLAGSEPEAGAAFEASALHRRDDRVEGLGELALVVPRWSVTSLRVRAG